MNVNADVATHTHRSSLVDVQLKSFPAVDLASYAAKHRTTIDRIWCENRMQMLPNRAVGAFRAFAVDFDFSRFIWRHGRYGRHERLHACGGLPLLFARISQCQKWLMARLVYINGIATSHRQSHFDISEVRRATTRSTSTSSNDQVVLCSLFRDDIDLNGGGVFYVKIIR